MYVLSTEVIADFFSDGDSSSYEKIIAPYTVSSSGDITLTVVDTQQFAGKVMITKAAS